MNDLIVVLAFGGVAILANALASWFNHRRRRRECTEMAACARRWKPEGKPR